MAVSAKGKRPVGNPRTLPGGEPAHRKCRSCLRSSPLIAALQTGPCPEFSAGARRCRIGPVEPLHYQAGSLTQQGQAERDKHV